MNTKKQNVNDAELEKTLAEMAKEGRLVEFLTDILAEADSPDAPDIEINGVALNISNAPPISDKSCYKKCLKESTKPGGESYSKCIKKCKPKKKKMKWNISLVAE